MQNQNKKKIVDNLSLKIAFCIYLIAPHWTLISCPFNAPARESFPLVFNWWQASLLDKSVARINKALPNGLQCRLINRIAALIVKELLINLVLVIFCRGSKSLRLCHHILLCIGVRSFLKEIRPRRLDVGGKCGKLLFRKQAGVFHHRRRP